MKTIAYAVETNNSSKAEVIGCADCTVVICITPENGSRNLVKVRMTPAEARALAEGLLREANLSDPNIR